MASNAKNVAELLNTDTTVKVADIEDGSVTTAKLAADAVTAAKLAKKGRNLVINGSMRVAQRAGFNISTTGSPEYGGPDRFHIWSYASSEEVVAAISQDTDVPSGQGFANSYKFDVSTAESAVASNEAVLIGTYLEAQNLQHLEYGTSSAKAITLSFWIKSTKTGTYCLSVTAPDGGRNYIKEYTVSASNTWEKKEITIPGDQSGTINNDNGQGLWLQWILLAGTDRHKAADSWSGTTSDIATSNQVNAVDNTSNNIYLTGVQLEVGSTATDFEFLSYGEELVLCQRYYQKYAETGGSGSNAYLRYGIGQNQTTTVSEIFINSHTIMRADPTLGTTGTFSNYALYEAGAVKACTNLTIESSGHSNNQLFVLSATVASGLTAGRAVALMNNNTSAGYLEFKAEL